MLLDITPLDLRVGVVGGLTESIVERSTPVPIEQTRRFTTSSDFQESVAIRVYQGDQREAEKNELLGQFEFSGFPSLRRGEVSIDVTFEIDSDGIVQVTAADPNTGKAASMTLTLTSGLSGEELEDIIEANRTARVAPSWRPPLGEEGSIESESSSGDGPSRDCTEAPVGTSDTPACEKEHEFAPPLFDENPIELALPQKLKEE